LKLFLPPAWVVAVQRIELDKVGVSQNVETVGIGKQLDTANALTNERLEKFRIPSPKKSTNCNEMVGRKMGLLG
jgi:hypothetical protein